MGLGRYWSIVSIAYPFPFQVVCFQSMHCRWVSPTWVQYSVGMGIMNSGWCGRTRFGSLGSCTKLTDHNCGVVYRSVRDMEAVYPSWLLVQLCYQCRVSLHLQSIHCDSKYVCKMILAKRIRASLGSMYGVRKVETESLSPSQYEGYVAS